jgi:hypothetical protein
MSKSITHEEAMEDDFQVPLGYLPTDKQWITKPTAMTEQDMLKSIIIAYDAMKAAKDKYYQHPGGGASQTVKNRLSREFRQKEQELDNTIFNVKQLITL